MADMPPYSTPRWVKVVGITALVLVLLVGVLLLTGLAGTHGPARHLPSGAAGATPTASGAVADTPFDDHPGDRAVSTEHGVRPS